MQILQKWTATIRLQVITSMGTPHHNGGRRWPAGGDHHYRTKFLSTWQSCAVISSEVHLLSKLVGSLRIQWATTWVNPSVPTQFHILAILSIDFQNIELHLSFFAYASLSAPLLLTTFSIAQLCCADSFSMVSWSSLFRFISSSLSLSKRSRSAASVSSYHSQAWNLFMSIP